MSKHKNLIMDLFIIIYILLKAIVKCKRFKIFLIFITPHIRVYYLSSTLNMPKYQNIYNSISDVVFIHDASSGEILFVNNRCHEVYGYTPEQLMEGGLSMLLSEEADFNMEAAMSLMYKAANGEEQNVEWKTKSVDGRVFWVEVRLIAITLDGLKRVMALVRDISDKKIAIESLKRSEQFQKTVNFFSSSLINKKGEEEILSNVVQNCIEILEFEDVAIYMINDQNELIQTAGFGKLKAKNGKMSEQLVLSLGQGIVGSVAQTGKGIIVNDLSKDDRYIVDIVRKNSELSVPIKYQGKILGVIDSEHPQKGFYTDLHLEVIETIAALTAIKIVQARSEEEVRKNANLLASINQNISEGVYRSRASGGLVYVNQAFVDMYGYESVEEVLQIRSQNLYAEPKQRGDLTDSIKKNRERGNVEALYKRKDGSTFWGLNTFILTTDQDGNAVFDGAIRDISKQKKNAEQLKMLNKELILQNKELAFKEQELEAFNEELISNRDNLVKILEELSDRNFELDQLIYRTSHDLRAPLRSVLGLTNLYNIEVKNPPNTYVKKIEERIHKMDGFIKSMLDYSKASRLAVKYSEVDIGELVDDCIVDLEFLEEFKKVEIIKKISTNNLKVVTDKLLLNIALSNIISNAFKYRNPKIDNSFLKIMIDIQQTSIHLSLQDNGIGIGKEYLEKVFDMFYRATETSEGSGLGMYIVKQSIDKLEGSITVESKKGMGTTFIINIPNQLEG